MDGASADDDVLHDHAAANSLGSGNYNDARGYLERERVHLALGDDFKAALGSPKRACSLMNSERLLCSLSLGLANAAAVLGGVALVVLDS